MNDHFGNYEIGFTILAIMAALGSVFFILATPPAPPGEVAVEDSQASEAQAKSRSAAPATGGGA